MKRRNRPISESTASGSLLHNLTLFARLLRWSGIEITSGRVIAAARALSSIDIGSKEDFYFSLRCTLVHNRDDLAIFDQVFNHFWRSRINVQQGLLPGRRSSRRSSPEPEVRPLRSPNKKGNNPPEQSLLDGDQPDAVEAAKSYSSIEILREMDFAEMNSRELEAVQRLMAELIWRLGSKKTRRYRPGKGQLLDFRRSFRGNLRYGGELLVWSQRQRRKKPRPLVIIADVSGSMERYSRLLLQFVYSLSSDISHSVETFVFSTRLTRITRQLRDKDVDRAMDEVSQTVLDWSGGTRIGSAVKDFNYDWSRRVLGGGAVVLMISDGWDRGDIELLSLEMARLQRSCFRLIWLNPLLGLPNYQPVTRGMEAALPFIDDFLPVHNLLSLEKLAAYLIELDEKRPRRRQQSSSLRRPSLPAMSIITE